MKKLACLTIGTAFMFGVLASPAFATEDPVPGLEIILKEVTPGGTIPTRAVCLQKKGRIVHKDGHTFCALRGNVAITKTRTGVSKKFNRPKGRAVHKK